MRFFFLNFAFNGLGSRGHREVCTSFKSLLKMLSDSGRFSSGHFRWKEKNRFIFSPVSSLRLMPSSLPNGSASVEPTPRWPVVGTLMGGRAHQRQPSFPTTHRAFPTTHNTQHTTTHNNTQPTKHNTQCITYNPHSLTLTHSLTHSPTHPLTHSPTHPHTQSLTHSLTHSLTPSLPPSLTRSLTHFTSLHFTSFHFTHSLPHSLTYIIIIIIIMCQRCLPATGHAERDHKMCGCARKSAEHYFGQRKYGEHTIVLIVCRKKKTSEPGGTR